MIPFACSAFTVDLTTCVYVELGARCSSGSGSTRGTASRQTEPPTKGDGRVEGRGGRKRGSESGSGFSKGPGLKLRLRAGRVSKTILAPGLPKLLVAVAQVRRVAELLPRLRYLFPSARMLLRG